MTKIQFTLLSFILAALFSSSMVSANPMKSVQKVNPIPMFMPILVKQSDKLALTPKQVDAFAKWRGENMAPAVKATTAIIEGEKAVKKATLEGVELSKIKSMLNDIAKARADLTDRTLRCHTYTKEILTESQWVKLLTIYKKKMG